MLSYTVDRIFYMIRKDYEPRSKIMQGNTYLWIKNIVYHGTVYCVLKNFYLKKDSVVEKLRRSFWTYFPWLNNFWILSKSKEVLYLHIWWWGGKYGKTESVFDVDHCKRTVKKRKMTVNTFWNNLRSEEKC